MRLDADETTQKPGAVTLGGRNRDGRESASRTFDHPIEVTLSKQIPQKEERMKTLILAICTVVALGAGTGIVRADADSMADKEAKPTLGERVTNATVKGTLMNMAGEYYSIKDSAGKEIKLHVDASTKLDKVMVGDKVKAYVADGGHITTLQRDE
jgi:hypothetical protein